jgi:cell division protein ZapB
MSVMATSHLIEQITERVDRVLLRQEELQRTKALLAQQVHALTQERDLLKAKLNAAKQRLDAVLAELPDGGAGLIGPAGDADEEGAA